MVVKSIKSLIHPVDGCKKIFLKMQETCVFFILRTKKRDKNPYTHQHKISSVHMVTEITNPKPSTVPHPAQGKIALVQLKRIDNYVCIGT